MRQQQRDAVGFGDIVVAAQIQRLKLVQGGIPAGEDEDGDLGYPADFHA